jgi:hypothetical protein
MYTTLSQKFTEQTIISASSSSSHNTVKLSLLDAVAAVVLEIIKIKLIKENQLDPKSSMHGFRAAKKFRHFHVVLGFNETKLTSAKLQTFLFL